jgi:predicted Zn-dependent peptidase
LLYRVHPLRASGIGTLAPVATLDRDRWSLPPGALRPDATVISVVGDVSTAEVRAALVARLGTWRRPATPRR